MLNSDIISECRGIIQQTDANNSTVSDSLLLSWIDACTLQLFSILNTLPKGAVPGLVAAETLTMPANLLKLDYASIQGPAGNHLPLTTIDFVNFCKQNAGWEDAIAAQPELLVRMDDVTWMMFPKPNTDYIGNAVTVYGTLNPVIAATATSSPQINIVMHSCYPHYLAWKSFLMINDPARAGQEYAAYDSLRKQNQGTATTTTGSLKQLTMPPNI